MADQWNEYAREMKARRVERRQFLKGALGVSGLALLNGTPLARAAFGPTPLPDPKTSGLDVIVTTMMENRTLDHFFGWIPGIDGLREGFSNPRSLAVPGDLCGARAFESPLEVDDPTEVMTRKLPGHCDAPDPDHGWNGARIERNHGMMNGFVERSGDHAMGYYNREDIPFLGWLGAEFTTFSRYFSSVLGPTYPNRLYWLSAQGGTAKGNTIPAPSRPTDPMPTGWRWQTIFDSMSQAGVDWAYYGTDLPTIALFFRHMYLDPGRIRHITDYYVDAAAGRLPNVVFVDPSFEVIGNDYHPAHDIYLAERYVQDVFLALAQGPQWSKSAFCLTFDEGGGFYDHVTPGRAPDLRANGSNHCDDWGSLGFRVPTVMASPLARRQSVGENVYDHTSILKMIEWRWNLPPLTPRDAAANNIAEVLDFDPAHKKLDLPGNMPYIPVHEAGIYCAQNSVADSSDGENPLEPLPDVPLPTGVPKPFAAAVAHSEMSELADAGYFGKYDFRDRAKAGVHRD